MIKYGHGTWGMQVLCRLQGSVVPKALVWSVPCALMTTLLHVFLRDAMTETIGTGGGIETIWAGYTFILGFLIVFRSNQAYSRFWESVTLTHKIRGQWTNAYSNLLAFCSTDQAREEEVSHFREYLLRLMSLLHCYALHQVCEMSDDRLEVIDLSGLSPDTVDFLHSCTSSDRLPGRTTE
ncbi:Ubiquitin-conjugating enzyme E2 11 [Durusdinium trenchii]|uniref:Ubiquitin-conjugating enzyme E2 11 n=2 Tax=Durusdinium trenchii TaxID=1381693 RepID=A0ABP0Q740_9DINO